MLNLKKWGMWVSFLGFSSVALGAFGAHGLKNILTPYDLEVFHKAHFYQITHTCVLLALILLKSNHSYRTSSAQKHYLRSLYFFSFGIIIFSGSLYLLAITHFKILGAITPIGGISFLMGWLQLFLYFKREES
jgi:uncharacterized membrane protein YgdD (TMEM256/DUF423 family)